MSIKDRIIEKGIESLKRDIEIGTSKGENTYKITGISEPTLPSKE